MILSLHILPSQLDELSMQERAFIYASTLLRVEDEKREASKIKAKNSGGHRRR